MPAVCGDLIVIHILPLRVIFCQIGIKTKEKGGVRMNTSRNVLLNDQGNTEILAMLVNIRLDDAANLAHSEQTMIE